MIQRRCLPPKESTHRTVVASRERTVNYNWAIVRRVLKRVVKRWVDLLDGAALADAAKRGGTRTLSSYKLPEVTVAALLQQVRCERDRLVAGPPAIPQCHVHLITWHTSTILQREPRLQRLLNPTTDEPAAQMDAVLSRIAT